ncbi:MAG: hypothetical protein Q6351_004795 [Candidatus Njordarchaeum guaymaensis]
MGSGKLLGAGLTILFSVYLLLSLMGDVIFVFAGSGLYWSLAQILGFIALVIVAISILVAIKNKQWATVALFFLLLGLAFIYAYAGGALP